MGAESSNRGGAQSVAVFLSYASQDAEAAQKICDSLRAGGIEVWLDQSELRGGDAWDRQIRKQIHDCALFIPLISQHTQERLEGYFRLEWKLAVERSYRMAAERSFVVPVVVDLTRDRVTRWYRIRFGTCNGHTCQAEKRLRPLSRASQPQRSICSSRAILPGPTPLPGPKSIRKRALG